MSNRQPISLPRIDLAKVLGCTCALIVVGLAPFAHGDIFLLKTGGQIQGTEVKRDDEQGYVVRTEQGALVTLSRRQVDDVVRHNEFEVEYRQRSRTSPDTADAHRELANWCQQNNVESLAERHWQRLLELAPNDEEARNHLGFQQHQGRWLTREDIMTARGLQFYEGEYRTQQDIFLRQQADRQSQTESEWYRNLRLWVNWLDDRRAAEAADLIAAVDDPLAASALVKLLDRAEDQSVRDLLTATLAELQHPLAVTTLINLSLDEPDREVRLQCVDYLLRYHQPVPIKPYVDALDSRKSKNHIINRAAEALQQIGDPKSISPLIDALVTTHRVRIASGPSGNINPAFNSSGGAGFSAGSKPEFVNKDFPNINVRRALRKLSGGQDYEFDKQLWRRWYVNHQNQQHVDTRRDQ